MLLIRDDPIVRCLERSGLPPWAFGAYPAREETDDCPPKEDDDGEDQEALLAFQTDHGLDADGIAGEKTWNALLER